jgi:hypothetical protein
LKEARRNLETEPVKAANELVATLDRLKKTSATDCFPPELKSELLRAARLSLDDAKRTTRVAIRADRYQAAARTANQLNLSLERAATLVGLKDELQEFCESCRFLAELAEQAGKSDPP